MVQHKRFSRFLSILVVAVLVTQVSGQGPYRLSWKKELCFAGGIGLASGITLALNNQIVSLTAEEIGELDATDLNPLDRVATRYWSGAAYRRSNYGEAIPLILASASSLGLPVASRRDPLWSEMATLLIILAETNLTAMAGTHMVKNLTTRTRPFVYNPEVSLDLKQRIDARKSFFSGHVSVSAANAFFVARVVSDYYPDNRWMPLVWSLAVAIPAWTGVERILAGKHFPTDVIAGYAFGALCGYLVPGAHLRKEISKELTLRAFPYTGFSSSGVRLTMNF